MRQERAELRLAHFGWVPDLVEEDVAPDPVHVGLLGSWAVVADPDRLTNQVQQLGLDRRLLSGLAVPYFVRLSGSRAARGIDGHRGMPSMSE